MVTAVLVAGGWLCAVPAVRVADQAATGAGNAASAAVAGASPLVRSAMRRLEQVLETVRERDLREQTTDALFNPQTCIQHRSGLTAAKKQTILDALGREGLYAAAAAAAFPGGAGGAACPKLPQAFHAAPGSNFGSHHSYPGGLAIHEGFNVSSALSFAENYRLAYGTPGADELPRMSQLSSPVSRQSDLEISQDEVVAAPLWHDWAKTLVFQWNADGAEFAEFNFGGSGQTDNYGQAGDSRTGGHHVLSLAETIARGLLTRDDAGNLRLPPRQNAPGQPDLKALAPRYGYDPADAARHTTRFRNPALSFLSAERVLISYTTQGLGAVQAELDILRNMGAIEAAA